MIIKLREAEELSHFLKFNILELGSIWIKMCPVLMAVCLCGSVWSVVTSYYGGGVYLFYRFVWWGSGYVCVAVIASSYCPVPVRILSVIWVAMGGFRFFVGVWILVVALVM